MITHNHKIKDFISTYPRHRLVIVVDNKEVEDLMFFDIGLLLAQEIKKMDKKKVVFALEQILERIINERKLLNNDFGEYIAIQNIGLLFEAELKFNFQKFIENISQNLTFLLKWDGAVDNKILHFINKKNNHKIDLKNVSHIIL